MIKLLRFSLMVCGAVLCAGCSTSESAQLADVFLVNLDVSQSDSGCLDCVDVISDTDSRVDLDGGPVSEEDSRSQGANEPTWQLSASLLPTAGEKIRKAKAGVLCGDGGLVLVQTPGETDWTSLSTQEGVDIAGCDVRPKQGSLAADKVAIVGEQGYVRVSELDTWRNLDLIEEGPGLRDVYIVDEEALLVVGVAGSAYRWDSAAWEKQVLPTDSTLEAVAGAGERMVVVGDQVLLLHDGTAWEAEEIPADPLGTPAANAGFHGRDVFVTSNGDGVWAVGDHGKVLFRGPQGAWSRQDAKWQATPFVGVFAPSSPLEAGLPVTAHAVGSKGLYRRWTGNEWVVPLIESPEFIVTNPPTPWPDSRTVPQQATLSFVGGWELDNGDVHLVTDTGIWVIESVTLPL